jgi:hypothetical protein
MSDTEADEPFKITTADMLEIVASGGNGSELVDLPSLLEKAAKELRDYETEVTLLRKVLRPFKAAVFNDNGSVTISTGHITSQDYINAHNVKETP